MVDEVLPESAEPVSDALRAQGVELLRRLVGLDKLTLTAFDAAIDRMLAVTTIGEFDAVVRSLPAPVEITPPGRRMNEPLSLNAVVQSIRLRGRWQVARDITVRCGTGNVVIDLTEAEWDSLEINLRVQVGTGSARIIVPRGTAVQFAGQTSVVDNRLDPALPGYPVVRLQAFTVTGRVRLRHPKQGRRLRRRRRSRELPSA